MLSERLCIIGMPQRYRNASALSESLGVIGTSRHYRNASVLSERVIVTPERYRHALAAAAGYRMKIGDSDDKTNTGRLHVDYAQARDDLYEWECLQRVWAREQRHRDRMEEERLRPPSPPPVVHYSDMTANVLLDKIKGRCRCTRVRRFF